jgi:hypothetical protein
MGFFDNLVSGIKTTVSNIVESVKVTSKISQIQTIAPNISAKEGVIGTAVAGTVATAVLNPGVSVPVGKYILSKPLQSLVIGASVPVVVSAVSSSKTLQKEIVESPQSLVNFGKNVGEFVDNPSPEKAKEIVTENPIVSGITAGGIILGLAGGATSFMSYLSTKENTKAVKENTQIMQTPAEDLTKSVKDLETNIDKKLIEIKKEVGAGVNSFTSTTPTVTPVSSPIVTPVSSPIVKKKPVKKKKKAVKKKKKAVKKKKKPVKKKKKPVKKKKKKKKYK